MATVLDVGLLRSFDIIFPFLLVWALVFAILQKTKMLGDRLGLNVMVAVVVAFLVLLSDDAINIIKFIIPWFTIAIIFFILLLLIFQLFGAQDKDIFAALKGDRAITWVIIGVAIVIIFAAFGNVFGQKLTEAAFQQGTVNVTEGGTGVATPSFQSNIYATLFHPKVLGMLILFAIAIFAVALLSGG